MISLLSPLLLTAQLAVPAPASAPVELTLDARDRRGEVLKDLPPADLTLLEDGAPRSILRVAPRPEAPWRLVIYFDRVLSGSRTLRAAAGALAEQSRALVALGSVEVVVAEPEPRVVLAATRDVAAVDDALSRFWLTGDGREDARVLRQRFVEETAGLEADADLAGLAEEAVDTEVRLVRRQQELMTEWLFRQPGKGPQALFLVTDGYDLDPGAFYRSRLAGLLPATEPALEKVAAGTAQTVAALGWTVLSLPVGDPSLPDLRRIRPGTSEKIPIGITVPLGRKPKPKDDKTPEPPPLPALARPRQPLDYLAEASGGEVAIGPRDVPALIRGLGSRFVLTYEASAPAAGKPRNVQVQLAKPEGAILRARRWEVAGTPEWMAAARARRAFEGDDEEQGLAVDAALRIEESATGERSALVELRLEPDPPETPRLTVVDPGFALATYPLTATDEPGVYRAQLPLAEGTERLALLVEKAAGGAWGSDVVFLEEVGEEVAVPSRAAVRLLQPPGEELSGRVRLRATGEGAEIARVAFLVEGREAATCAALPCEVEVDLGRRVRRQLLAAVAYAADGRELGRDSVLVNEPGEGFRVRIVSPAGGQVTGPVEVEADVRVPGKGPGQRKIERVEFFWNDQLVATLYSPPYRKRLVIPPDRPAGYLRVEGRLTDGTTAEDAVAVNAAQVLGERVDVRLVELFVVVTDRDGKPVRGLTRESFHVRQDGREQEISHFENAGELPLTVALTIDSSASMFVKLPDVRDAVASLLGNGLTTRDRALLVDFDTKPRLVQPVTRDLGGVAGALTALTPDGGSNLFEAVVFSLTQLQGVGGRKALVVYSDGVGEGEDFPYRTCLRFARESGIPVYLIVTNPQAARGEDKGGLLTEPYSDKIRRLADATGGKAYFVLPNQPLAAVYQEILQELRSQYTLSFYPKDPTGEAWRKVEVEVEGRGLTARTLSGYSARR